MSIREYVGQRRWSLLGPVLPGGTVYALVLSPNKEQHNPLVAGTPVGVFRSLSRGNQWAGANRGLVGLQVSTLAASPNGVLFLGTLEGSLARSVDGGYSWMCLPELEDAGSITAIAVSPDYLKDGTILVGTDSGGVYRSTDSGRTNKAANFGLTTLSVISLACAPGWPQKPVAFAGTVDGLFRSTNGGRAWRACRGEVEGISVQALAVSPAFVQDGIVFAGTEEDGLFRSRDGGSTWERIGGDIPEATINAIWVSPQFKKNGLVFAGTSSSGIFRSTDGGETWASAFDAGSAVLSLTGDSQSTFVGLHGAGVYCSADEGISWQPCNDGLHGNAFTQLTVGQNGKIFVSGPAAGIYSSDDSYNWQEIQLPNDVSALAALAIAPTNNSAIMVSDLDSGVYLSQDAGASWTPVLEEPATALASANSSAGETTWWAGTAEGKILISEGKDIDWTDSQPFPGQAVLKLTVSPGFSQDTTLLAATRSPDEANALLHLWRSTDAGVTWEKILSQNTELQQVSLALDSQGGNRVLAVMDRYYLVEIGAGDWERTAVGPSAPPALSIALRYVGDTTLTIIGTASGVFCCEPGAPCRPLSRGMGNQPILDLAPSSGDDETEVWALGLGGLIWKLSVLEK